LLSITSLTFEVSPVFLKHVFPRDQPGHLAQRTIVPVTLFATVSNDAAGPPTLLYQVIDSFGKVQPSGAIPTTPVAPGQFIATTRIGLSIQRSKNDPQQVRQYTIVLTATDVHNSQTASAVALVAPRRALILSMRA
jgi:hypothetical protein